MSTVKMESPSTPYETGEKQTSPSTPSETGEKQISPSTPSETGEKQILPSTPSETAEKQILPSIPSEAGQKQTPCPADADHDTETATSRAFSHKEALLKAKDHLTQLLSDPFLQDLPPDISLDELTSKLALEQGRAITIHLRRYDDDVIPIIVLQGATVADLMKVVEKETTRRCLRHGRTVHISWRYVWKTYWLAYQQQRLEDINARLSSYGIGNHSEITFVKKLRRENKPKRPNRTFY